MSYSRKAAPVGQYVTLRAMFSDPSGLPVSIDKGIVYIYSETPSKDFETIVDEEDYSESYDSVTSIEKVGEGFYEISYLVPDVDAGTWNDLWVVEINGIKCYAYFSFNIKRKNKIELQVINQNTLVVILLSPDIADTSGNTLGEEYQLSFSTKYNPYYASPDLVRLEVGQMLDPIPDDTLSLFIHWASMEANAITGAKVRNRQMYDLARTKFVIYDTVLRALMLPVNLAGKTKRLGDLMIQNESSFKDVIPELKKIREEWYRVVNAGGGIVPGQGLNPTYAVKGIKDPNRGLIGRNWHSSYKYPYRQPAGNFSLVASGEIKAKKGFVDFIVDEFGRRLKEPD